MVKIFSPASGGADLGQMLSALGKQMFGDKTGSELNKEKLRAAQRENTEIEGLASRVAGGGAQTMGADPIAQAQLMLSGYDPSKFADLGLMGAATEFGARDPRTQNWQVGSGQSFDNTAGAFDAKLGETRRSNDLASADRRYGTDRTIGQQMYEFTNVGADQAVDNAEVFRNNNVESLDRRYNTDQTVGQQRYEFDAKPIAALGPDGKPVFAPQGNAATGGFAPILSEADQKGTLLGANFANLPALDPNQQEVLGARIDPTKGGTPRNYRGPDGRNYITFDGAKDVNGAPLPPGGYLASVEGSAADTGLTNSVTSGMQSDVIANKKFNFLVDEGLALTSDPTLFGPQGLVSSLYQELAQGVQGTAALFGPGSQGNDALRVAQDELRTMGVQAVLPEIYNPNLSKVETIWGLLVFQGAAALAGQQNRSVSDKDVLEMRKILGSPQSMFSSAEMMKSKLQTAKQIIGQYDAISREALGGTAPVTPAAPAGAPAPGTIEEGHQFIGGDPANPASWRPVQ